MALKEYNVNINGLPHVLQLDEVDAERLGDRASLVEAAKGRKPATKAAAKPANKAAAKPADKAAPAADDKADEKPADEAAPAAADDAAAGGEDW